MKILILLVLAIGLVVPLARAGDDLMASQLVDQAREWQQKDRDDIAAELWRKLLRADPKHPEALVQLGVIEARAGNFKEAGALYDRASKLAKPPAGLSALALALGAAKGKPGNLAPPPKKPELAKPEPARVVPPKPSEPAEKTAPDKRIAPQVDDSPAVTPPKKAQTPAAINPPKAESNQNSNQKTEADTLNLKSSESINLVR